MNSAKLSVEYLPVGDLRPYERNAKKHPRQQLDQIKRSILDMGNGDPEKGFLDPIGIWGEQNIVVEGHGRLIAAKELHLDRVPCIRLDHMTDAQRREYAIRHNRTQEFSSWDFEKLEQEIAALAIAGTDLSGLKFAIQTLADENPAQEFIDGENKHVCPRCGHEWSDDDGQAF